MEASDHKKYFSLEELKKLNSMQGKTLSDVIYFVWINRTNSETPLVFIDKLQLKFSDNTAFTITAGEESDALQFVENFDPYAEAVKLNEEFEGKIMLKPHNSSGDKFWKDVVNKKIESVELSKKDNDYLSDAVVLDFGGEEKRLIAISPEEGIIIDYYEEV